MPLRRFGFRPGYDLVVEVTVIVSTMILCSFYIVSAMRTSIHDTQRALREGYESSAAASQKVIDQNALIQSQLSEMRARFEAQELQLKANNELIDRKLREAKQ